MSKRGDLYAWLAEAGLRSIPITELLDGFCAGLGLEDIPVERVTIAMATLDPSVRAQSLIWERGKGSLLETFPHGESNEAWRESPLAMMVRSHTGALRRRLIDPLVSDDFPLFSELKEQGFTDWTAFIDLFHWEADHVEGGGMGMVSSWMTQAPSGFSEAQLQRLRPRIQALAAAVKSLVAIESACNILSTYVGEDAAQRVLRGAVTRGSVTQTLAVLMFADLAGFTRYSAEQPIDMTLDTLNRSFDCVGIAIEKHGGEILKFIGDGVLAVFMLDESRSNEEVAAGAVDAAEEAQRLLAQADLPLDLDIALHVGRVSYGNIGTARRLDFTVIGRAVNEVARMEPLCGLLDEPILISAPLANLLPGKAKRLRSLGSQALRGLDKMEVFGLTAAPPSAS